VHDLEVADLRAEVARLQDLHRARSGKDPEDCERVQRELRFAASDGSLKCPVTISTELHEAGATRSGCIREEAPWGPSKSDSAPPNKVPSSFALQVPEVKLPIRLSGQAAAVMTPAAARACRRQITDKDKTRAQSRGRSRSNIIKGSSIALALAERTCMQRFVDHTLFDLVCAFMIIVNSVIIGFEVQWLTTHDAEPTATQVLGVLCSAFFFGELSFRIAADGMRWFFFNSDNKNWNWFDFALVAMSFFDVLAIFDSNGRASSIGMGFKTIKMLRIIRVVRVFRFFRKLSHLAFMIIDSVRSLFWALIMLGIVIYVFAIFFTHYTTEHMKSHNNSSKSTLIEEHFGDLWTTLYTLFHSMLNGISWYTIPNALYNIPGLTGPALAFGFCGYVTFTMLAVMNIITGVFVDNAVETARTQREFLVQREQEVKEQWLREMREIFLEMDSDNSETVNRAEMKEFCNDDRVQFYLTALGLDVNDTQRLFELLDANRDGELELDEFLEGCLRLKGMARSIDVYSLIHQQRQLCKRLDEIDDSLHERVGTRKHKSSWLMTPLSARGSWAALSARGSKNISVQETEARGSKRGPSWTQRSVTFSKSSTTSSRLA